MSLKKILFIAGIYNLIWGAINVLFPKFIFETFHIELPKYLEFWQCIGMIVGVYGLGYIIASKDYVRHWPIVLVGFLGKIFGPIGFIQAVARGVFPISFGWTILMNDLIWWIPFFMMLKEAYNHHQKTS